MASLFNLPKDKELYLWQCPCCREEYLYTSAEELKRIKLMHFAYSHPIHLSLEMEKEATTC